MHNDKELDSRLRDDFIKGFVDLYNTVFDDDPEKLSNFRQCIISSNSNYIVDILIGS